jgi:transcriptional regulator with XRE-family HTH domain/endogenous inhibitor of DNA gyrase (YacG/DUF329 family)
METPGQALANERQRRGLSQRELARRVGVQPNTVNKIEGGKTVPRPETRQAIASVLEADQAELFAGFPARPTSGQRPKYPPPPERTCELEGCENLIRFRSPSAAITRGRKRQGRYCSVECRIEGTRKHPKPIERACARPGCEIRFTPKGAQLGRGAGLYCSLRCWGVARPHPRTGELVACARCGTEVYRAPSHSGYRFCSHRCWGKHRWVGARETVTTLVETMNGKARRKIKLAWAPRPGRRRNDERLDYEEALERIRTTYAETHASERELERLTGESRRMIRVALRRSLRGSGTLLNQS